MRLRLAGGLLAALLPLLTITQTAQSAEKFAFRQPGAPQPLQRVDATLEVGGDLKLKADGELKTLPMSVVAELRYDEAVGGTPDNRRALRHFHAARAIIKIAKGGQEVLLPAERRLIALHSVDKTPTVYSPSGPLTREQLDLIDVPLARLVAQDLLPAEPLAVGGTWQLDEATLAALLGLDAVDFAEVQGAFGEVTAGHARLALAGSVRGAVAGISTEIQLKGKLTYDLDHHHLARVQLYLEEKRAIGHVGPGIDVAAKLTVDLAPLDSSPHVSAQKLAELPAAPSDGPLQLEYVSTQNRFRFGYDRRWVATSDEQDVLVLRLIDRGELVAQCNLSCQPTGEQNRKVTLESFQADVQHSLGKNFGQFAQASQSVSPEQCRVYRVAAVGKVQDLPIRWIYYLIGNDQGQQVTLAFTLEQSLESRFGDADADLAGAIRFLAATPSARHSGKKSVLKH